MSKKHAPPFKHKQQMLQSAPRRPGKVLKVLIAVPSTGIWMADFGAALVNMVAAFCTFKIEGWDQQMALITNIKGSVLPKSRWLCVQEALEKECEYLIFIDSDQTFPRKMLHLLLSRKVDCVAANIATKVIPAQPTARNKDPGGDPLKWVTVYTDPESTGLERVDRIGTGIMMLSRRVMQLIRPPDFDMKWREDVENYQGEDWWLCQALEREGVPIYIDQDLSKEVGHIGFYNFTHDVVGEIQRVRDSKQGQSQEAA